MLYVMIMGGGTQVRINYINSHLILIIFDTPIFQIMTFNRKWDLKKKNRVEGQGIGLGESSVSTDLEEGRGGESGYAGQMEKFMKLGAILGDLQPARWQKQASELFGCFLDNQRVLLASQQLAAYRESITLVVKYQQELRRRGKELTEENGSLILGLLRRVLEEVSRLTQEEKNDSMVLETAIIKPIFSALEAFVSHLESESSRTDRRPTLMRKNSLKKVEELPAVRPSSRGKLSSLSKKDPTALSKQEIVCLTRPKPEAPSLAPERGCMEDIIMTLCSIVKNLSANTKLRREIMVQEYLRLLNRYLCIWSDKTVSNAGSLMLMQLTACYRHLAVQQKSYRAFLQSNCLEAWARLIQLFPTNQQLMFSVLRTLSKVSNYQSVCIKLNQKRGCVKTLSSFFKFYKSNIHIVVRVAITFANLTSYLADVRSQLYFDLNAWQDIYQCFDHYASRELSGRNQVQKMGLSMAAWDYQHIKKESDIDCAIRIVRLIANLFTLSPIGQDIYMNHSNTYRELVKKLKAILDRKSNLQRWAELIATILSCLTNILFYDKELLMTNPQHKMVKVQLVHSLVDYVVQIDNQEVCCESLRVVANLTRIKQFCPVVIQAKIHEGLLILLESTSKEIVYYCLGVLSNLIADNNFKQTYQETILAGVIGILNDCDNDDFDVVTVALKTLAAIADSRNQNLHPKLMADVQTCLMGLGGHCDRVLSRPGGEVAEVLQSRSLINMLLNNMPQEKFICSVKNCGRKFADEAKLQEHVRRRHKV